MIERNLKICAALFASASLFMLFVLSHYIDVRRPIYSNGQFLPEQARDASSAILVSFAESTVIMLFFCLIFAFAASMLFQSETGGGRVGLFIASLPIARRKLWLMNSLSVLSLYSLLFIFYGGINLSFCREAVDFADCVQFFVLFFCLGLLAVSLFLLMQTLVLRPSAALGLFAAALLAPRVLFYGFVTFFGMPEGYNMYVLGNTPGSFFRYITFFPLPYGQPLPGAAVILALAAMAFYLAFRLSSFTAASVFGRVFIHKNIYGIACVFCFLCFGSFFCRYAGGKPMALLIFIVSGALGLKLLNKLLSSVSGGDAI